MLPKQAILKVIYALRRGHYGSNFGKHKKLLEQVVPKPILILSKSYIS